MKEDKKRAACVHAMATGQMLVETDVACPNAYLCGGRFACTKWACQTCGAWKPKKAA